MERRLIELADEFVCSEGFGYKVGSVHFIVSLRSILACVAEDGWFRTLSLAYRVSCMMDVDTHRHNRLGGLGRVQSSPRFDH